MDLEATESERKQLEYSTQFFEFTPDAFVDSISAPTVDMVSELLDRAKEKCAEEFVGKVSNTELEESFSVIKDNYSCHANEVMEKLGRYLKKNMLSIPKEVVLPEDRVRLTNESSKKYMGDDLNQDLMQFEHLRLEVNNAKYTKAVLETKLANLETVAARQQKVLRESENLAVQGKALVGLIDQQREGLNKKIEVLKPILEKVENNCSTLLKEGNKARKTTIDSGILAKRVKLPDDQEN